MNRTSISFSDKQEADIKNYMIKNNISLKSKAVREIVDSYFQYETNFEDLKKLSKKVDSMVGLLNVIKSLSEQIYMNMGIRENQNPKDNESLQEFYDTIKKINFIIMN